MIRLIEPALKYKKSYMLAMKEFARETGRKQFNVKDLNNDFSAFIEIKRNHKKGINLPKGYVPCSYYWLMDGSEFIGETTIRHKLNGTLSKEGGHIGYGIRPTKRKMGYGNKILSLALQKARKLGIRKALLTCDDDNVGSWKIIENNGGILQNKIKYNGKTIRRYWVRT